MRDTNGTYEHATEQGHAHEHGTPAAALVSADFGVAGMTCSHCVSSVTEELARLDGVKHVDIQLVAGGVSRVTVASEASLDEHRVAAAIDEAGYELVGGLSR
ncbi:heavy-metal-associated domain-containing protein [Agromyces sp. ISL-38]|uniref:heavy-metal-associated domain-containing protein n=1 Tax=Agromyces sp. ISL-38 TaxID=2819107 RepID=UPI001BED3953|nr:heavy-metal-associated domain-containing protein [Agromyces sp. ISL-38]MBT2497801.1 heavy-metal-associated domain-containing protein [Agromyces sp. ISL-38]MBT2517112.1 heavy-metal-associated domain-containing protein [Streptomyces sp. ISL-90]